MAEKSTDAIESTRGIAALRHRDFAIFSVAKLLVLTSHHMLLIAVGYQIYDITGDALALAYTNLVMIAPTFLFALVTGYVCDRYDRRLVVLGGYTCMALTAACLWLLTELDLAASGWVYATLLLNGTARAFFNPATNALIPNLVPANCFANSVAWNTTGTKTSQIVGPMLGGLIYLLGPDMVYATSAVGCLAGVLLCTLIAPREAGSKSKRTNLRELLAGVVYVYRTKVILGAILLDVVVILSAGVTAVLPIIARDVLEIGPAGAGLLRSAMAMGGLAAALVMTRFPVTFRAGLMMFIGDAVLCMTAIVMGVSTWLALSIVTMAVMGMADMLAINIRQTLIQVATPNDMRGRVAAVSTIAGNSGYELGGFRAGLATGLFGIVPALVVGGAVGLALLLVCWKAFPDLARVQRADKLA